jgi:hypothetical protein
MKIKKKKIKIYLLHNLERKLIKAKRREKIDYIKR